MSIEQITALLSILISLVTLIITSWLKKRGEDLSTAAQLQSSLIKSLTDQNIAYVKEITQSRKDNAALQQRITELTEKITALNKELVDLYKKLSEYQETINKYIESNSCDDDHDAS